MKDLIRTPWHKIYDAIQRGVGLRLTADEVSQLASDDAIMTRGKLDSEGKHDQGEHGFNHPTGDAPK